MKRLSISLLALILNSRALQAYIKQADIALGAILTVAPIVQKYRGADSAIHYQEDSYFSPKERIEFWKPYIQRQDAIAQA